ncbi:ribosome biogenesis/translation initiation ATPase RLI [Thermoplasmatales archaeon SW_10_69_26]|nr:MAG: ribosome biogenesis/translation initiation ATPase RLI [Thermoplasmatales archaeon SW_10_69_26]
MRVAVLDRDKCQPKKCNYECINYCPKVRAGVPETIYHDEPGDQPVISEELCIGCGICVNKCPFDAIDIINLPDELEEDLVHQYDENAFRLFRLPVPKQGQVVGLLGPNGIGKSTALSFLNGRSTPNLGEWASEASWEDVLDEYAGTELHDYLAQVAEGEIEVATKPQYVDQMPKVVDGNVSDLLASVDERGKLDELVDQLQIQHTLDSELGNLSGGELQRVAIAATALKDADVYMFDEPSSYLDVEQRTTTARLIRELVDEADRRVLVVEHDLAILDLVSDVVHVLYGEQAAYGIMGLPRSTRGSINAYLDGFLPEENVRIREEEIEFTAHPPRKRFERGELVTYGEIAKQYGDDGFRFHTDGGTLHEGEVVGVLGPNGIGKTTLVKLLAGGEDPTEGTLDLDVQVSYKPQYLKAEFDGTVESMFYSTMADAWDDPFFQHEVGRPLGLDDLLSTDVNDLSGGELQRVACALCLGRDADLYLLDEPSAFLDVNQRMLVAKALRRVMEQRSTSALVVDHDVYLIDLIADSLMVFEGEPGVEGTSHGPMDMRDGMNRFLANVDVTFRRDRDTKRPRINKPGSRKDKEQKREGEYYYDPELVS